jgi:hypothetical protein
MNRKTLYIIAGVALVVIVIAIASVSTAASFRLVSTDPRNNDTPHQYATVSFKFSRPLAATSDTVNTVTFSPAVQGTTKVSGDTISFTPATSYSINVTYLATVKNVTSANGEHSGDASLSFTPKYVDVNQLPADVQKRLIQQTDVAEDKPEPYSPSTIAIAGSNDLVAIGMNDNQMNDLQAALYRFFTSKNQEVRAVTVGGIVGAPHQIGSFKDSATFDIGIESKISYHAKVSYLGNTIHLILTDAATGKQVYDSGELNVNQ